MIVTADGSSPAMVSSSPAVGRLLNWGVTAQGDDPVLYWLTTKFPNKSTPVFEHRDLLS